MLNSKTHYFFSYNREKTKSSHFNTEDMHALGYKSGGRTVQFVTFTGAFVRSFIEGTSSERS